MLPDPVLRRGLVQNLKLPEIDGRARLHNPLVAIQIALAGNAADMVKLHDTKPDTKKG